MVWPFKDRQCWMHKTANASGERRESTMMVLRMVEKTTDQNQNLNRKRVSLRHPFPSSLFFALRLVSGFIDADTKRFEEIQIAEAKRAVGLADGFFSFRR